MTDYSNMSKKTRINSSTYLKILLNYFQMLSILQSFDLKWPLFIEKYFNFSTEVSGISLIITNDCLLEDFNINRTPLFVETFFVINLPILIFFVASLFLLVLYIISKRSQMVRFVVIVIIVSIFLQPSIIKIIFDNLACKTIEEKSYLTANMTISCETNSYNYWVF